MKIKFFILSFFLFFLFVVPAFALNVVGIEFSEYAFVDEIGLTDFTGTYGSANNEILTSWENSLLGSDVYTWMEYGQHDLLPGLDGTYNSDSPPNQFVELIFNDNSAINGPMDDLVLFEYGEVNSIRVSLDLESLLNPYDPNSRTLVVTPVQIVSGVNAGYINLTDLGVPWGESVNHLYITSPLGENGEVYWNVDGFPNWGVPEVSALGALYTDPLPDIIQLNLQLDNGLDDVEQLESGEILFNSSDLEFVDDLTGGGNQTVGLRFRGVEVPYGAFVTGAYIEFETDEAFGGETSLVIRIEDSDDAGAFTPAVNDVGSRLYAVTEVPWENVEAWSVVNEKHQTPDLSSLVQSVVDRAGWNSGGSLVFAISGSGLRTAESYEGEPAAAALLHIEYR